MSAHGGMEAILMFLASLPLDEARFVYDTGFCRRSLPFSSSHVSCPAESAAAAGDSDLGFSGDFDLRLPPPVLGPDMLTNRVLRLNKLGDIDCESPSSEGCL